MFKELGQVMGLMKNLPKLQAAMQDMQEKIARIAVEGNAGGGMVVVTVNGQMEVTKCTITEEAMNLADREVLADLMAAAVNMGTRKAREEVARVSQAMAQDAGLPIPPGVLPGM
jgi:hypothetical protein